MQHQKNDFCSYTLLRYYSAKYIGEYMNRTKENMENLVTLLRRWQSIEDDSVRNTTEIIKRANNPVIHQIMEIIRQDSVTHRKVQQLIIDNFEKIPICLDPEELIDLWELITAHDQAEKHTIQLATYALEQNDSPMVKMLLEYLIADETKHDRLLTALEFFKDQVYPDDSVLPYI